MPYGGGALGRGSSALSGSGRGGIPEKVLPEGCRQHPSGRRTSIHYTDGGLQEPVESARAHGAHLQEVWGLGIGEGAPGAEGGDADRALVL